MSPDVSVERLEARMLSRLGSNEQTRAFALREPTATRCPISSIYLESLWASNERDSSAFHRFSEQSDSTRASSIRRRINSRWPEICLRMA